MSYIYFLASDTELKEMRNPDILYFQGKVILHDSSVTAQQRVYFVNDYKTQVAKQRRDNIMLVNQQRFKGFRRDLEYA